MFWKELTNHVRTHLVTSIEYGSKYSSDSIRPSHTVFTFGPGLQFLRWTTPASPLDFSKQIVAIT